MKFIKKFKKLILSLAILFIVCLGWIFRPHQRSNPENIDPTLKIITEPYKSIDTYFFMDGGSIGIEITGQNDRVFKACFYATDMTIQPDKNTYDGLSIGAIHYSEENSSVCKNIDTKLRLIEILREKKSKQLYDDACIAIVSDRLSDYIKIFWKRYILTPQDYMNY